MSQTPDTSAGGAGRQGWKNAWQRVGGLRDGKVRIGAAAAILVALGFILWAAIDSGSSGNGSSKAPTATTRGTGPVALSAQGLQTLARAFRQPVYWVGPRAQTRYELTRTGDGKIFVRYIPSTAKAGVSGQYLTVGTYPMKNALTVTENVAKGNVTLPVGGGAVAFQAANNSKSGYVAFPGVDFQVEVFDPTPGAAVRLVEQGAVSAVPTSGSLTRPSGPAVRAVTPVELKDLATSLGQPIYWVGPQPRDTYELTQTTAGLIYLRYLPSGVTVGDHRTFLTVGTYPVKNALTATRALANRAGYTAVSLSDGGIAVVSDSPSVKNVYVAYPNSNYQIEVFDPIPGNARELVTSHKLALVG